MMKRHMKPIAGLLCGTLLCGTLAATPAWAGDKDDGVSLWDAVKAVGVLMGIAVAADTLYRRYQEEMQRKAEEEEKQRRTTTDAERERRVQSYPLRPSPAPTK